jgi:7-keto-8-aminopelargonate synthetase-like enzyme
MSAIQSFATRGDLLFADSNIHSCLWSGIILSGVKSIRFKDNDILDLKKLFNEHTNSQPKLLVIEGVYSMEGHIAPIDKLTSLAKKHNIFTIVDDAHGFGVLGKQGRGTVDYFKSNKRVDIICGSFSKALSSTGGFVAGNRNLIDYLRTHSKQTIFSAAISPTQAASAEAALDIMREEPEHLEKL